MSKFDLETLQKRADAQEIEERRLFHENAA